MIIRNNDINTDENIFKTIYKINTHFKSIRSDPSIHNEFVSIIFDDNVRFVSPMFFSLVLLTHEKYIENNIALVIDILGFNHPEEYTKKSEDPRQHYVFRFLLPFFNSPYFKLEITEKNIDYLRDSYAVIIPDRVKRLVSLDENQKSYKKLIYLFCSKKPRDSLFLNESHGGTFLPIVKLTNFSNFFYDSDFYNDNKDDFDKRKNIFKSLTIDNEENIENLRDNFGKHFIKYVKPKNFDDTLLNPLKDVFFEMVDNIKRHAQYDDKSFADSYFNFYYDTHNGNFNFHIMDNFHTGLMNTYIKTLETDSHTFNELGLDGDGLYNQAIEELEDSKNDIPFLEALFSEGGWFHGNQIPRVILHFGMPLLAKIIKDTEGSAYIRLYRETDEGNIFYEVILNKDGTKVNDITETYQNIEGTYISITIPNTKYKGLKATSMVLSHSDYKNISDKEDEIVQRIKEFTTESKKIGKKTCAIYNYEQYTQGTISDFIRKIYIDAYANETKDILVTGINLKDSEDYFATLIYLLYSNDEDKERSDTPYMVRNILFWDKTSFDILFIGGKTKDEFYTSTKILNKHYGQQTDCLNRIELSEDLTTPADSIFFFKTGDDFMVIPFETIGKQIHNYDNILDNISIQRIIMEHLEKSKKLIHFDTKQGFHVDVYYKFDTIFQDSSYFGRIAFELKKIILCNGKLNGKKIAFIGIGKYLKLFMAFLVQSLENEKVNSYSKYEVFNFDNGDDDKINKFIKNVEIDNGEAETAFVLITAVSFGGKKIKEFIASYLANCSAHWYNIIQIHLEKQAPSNYQAKKSIINIEIPLKSYEELTDKFCEKCESPDSEIPLLCIDKDDEFKLEKTYFDAYRPKSLVNAKNVDSLKWYNTVAFGHIRRGSNNHYLYYTKSIHFFNDNKDKIIDFLRHELKKIKNPANAIIIIPMHCTLNKFTSLIHKELFDGQAKIFQLDMKKGIKNFHELEVSIQNASMQNFYFIDDEISSGSTLEYFYSLLRYLGVDGFEKIFVMIDRMDVVDETLCINYLRSKDKKDIHCFSKMEIKPIKTSVEDCFLCDTRDMYGKILKQTSLDMNRYAIAERIVKLNLLDSNNIDFEDTKDFNVKDFRIYLKMYAVDYVYENFDSIYFDYEDENYDRAKILSHYRSFECDFIVKVRKKIKQLPFKEKNFYVNLLDEIGTYEGRIALLKALSFPKLVYYYPIRYILTIVLIEDIRQYIKEKDAVEYYFDHDKMKNFIIAQKNLDGKVKNKYELFLEHFYSKVNMHYLSFLHKTAAYLNIHYILHIDNVKYYFEASKKIKDRDEVNDENKIEQSLVEYYQLAAKRVASYSKDRAQYLQNNIESVLKDTDNEDEGYPKLLEALLVENHYDKEITVFQKKCRKIFEKNEDFSILIPQIEKILQDTLDDYTIKIHAVYVNQHANLSYATYANYISSMKLVNVMGDYGEPLKKKEDIIYGLTKGYLSKFKNEIFNPDNSEHKKHIHNTWSNKYISEYILPNNEILPVTAIKLVDINLSKLDKVSEEDKKYDEDVYSENFFVANNSTLWYKPIGTLVVTYDKYTQELHLLLSKYILSIQNEFVEYLNERFSYGVIQETMSKYEKNKSYDALQEILERISHTYGRYIKISKNVEGMKNCGYEIEEILDKVQKYTIGLEYIFSIGSLYIEEKQANSLSNIDFSNDFLRSAKDFFEVVPILGAKEILTDNIDVLKSVKYDFRYQNNDNANHVWRLIEVDLYTIIFELMFNALKSNKDKKLLNVEIEYSNNGIYVRNNGSYIKSENIDKIFDRHFTTNSGTGIGLYNIQKYLEINMLNICVSNISIYAPLAYMVGKGNFIGIMFTDVRPHRVEFLIKDK